MKIILGTMFFCYSFAALAQTGRGSLTANDFKNLSGSWTGTLVYTGYSAQKAQVTFLTKLEITDMTDSLMFNYSNKSKDSSIRFVEKYSLYIYDNGNKLRFDSSDYDITGVRRMGSRISFLAERFGAENFKPTMYQLEITVDPANISIVKNYSYMDMMDYSIRYRMTLKKTK